MTPDVPPWDPEAYDRRILRERTARKRLATRPTPANKGDNTTITYTDRSIPRGQATEEELERRKVAERAMRIRARNQQAATAPRRRRPLPSPRQKPSGRWLARVVHHGQVHQQTFDTKREARDFINQLVNGDS